MKRAVVALSLVGFAVALMAVAALGPIATAAPRTFHLYGDFSDGWGDVQVTQTNPGPTLTVAQGDTVTVVIHSVDGAVHNWYLDLNGDGARDAGEPFTADASDLTAVSSPEFNAPAPGTYTYYCQYHQETMRGSFVVTAAGAPPGDSGLLLYAGIGIAIVIVAVVGVLAMRGRGKTPKPPTT